MEDMSATVALSPPGDRLQLQNKLSLLPFFGGVCGLRAALWGALNVDILLLFFAVSEQTVLFHSVLVRDSSYKFGSSN